MNRNDWIFLGVILLIIFSVGAMIIFAKIKADRGLIEYTNINGEDYKLVKNSVFNTTFYGVGFTINEVTYNYQFRNSPAEVDKIPLEKDVERVLNRPEGISILYITQDKDFVNKSGTDSSIAAGEFSRILGTNDYGVFKLNVDNTFTTKPDSKEKQIITCANVSNDVAVIYVKEGENKIYSEGDCLIVQGTSEDIIKVGDRLAYYLVGIVPYNPQIK